MYDYKNKELNLRREFDFLLSKTLSMFRYEGLPETMPHRDFERQLQTKGYAFITEFKGELYSFTDGLGGEPDAYGNPTEIVIANPALKFNKTLNLKEDGVLIRNDSMMAGVRNLMRKYLTMMNENEISMVMNSFNSRIPTLISAGDDTTKEAAEEYLRQVVKGELGIISENRLFEGINAQTTGASGYTQLIEYQQFLKATLYNELGLEMNNNMKRERLTEDEVNMVDTIYPFVDNMMMNREEGIKAVNKKYGKNIEVEFDSVWAKHNEQSDEEFLAEVEMYLDQMVGTEQEEPMNDLSQLFGDTSDEELQSILDELLELDEEEDDSGDNSSGSSDSPTDSTVGVEPDKDGQSESGESSKDTESSGTVGTDNTRPDADEPGDADEPDTGRGDETDSDDSDESSGTVESDVGEPDADNAGTDNESDRRSEGVNTERTESSTEEPGEKHASGEDIESPASSTVGNSEDEYSTSADSKGTSTSDTSGDPAGADSDEPGTAGTGEEAAGDATSSQSDTVSNDDVVVEVDLEVKVEVEEEEEENEGK